MADKPKATELAIAATVYRGKRLSQMSKEELIAAFIENDHQHKERIQDLQNAVDILVDTTGG